MQGLNLGGGAAGKTGKAGKADNSAETAAKQAAEKAAREAERVAQVIRDRLAEGQLCGSNLACKIKFQLLKLITTRCLLQDCKDCRKKLTFNINMHKH